MSLIILKKDLGEREVAFTVYYARIYVSYFIYFMSQTCDPPKGEVAQYLDSCEKAENLKTHPRI